MNKYQATLTLNQKIFLNAGSLSDAKELLDHLIQEYVDDEFVNIQVEDFQLIEVSNPTTYYSLSSYYNDLTSQLQETADSAETSSYVPYQRGSSQSDPSTYTRLTQSTTNS